jgi:hypothetical protein
MRIRFKFTHGFNLLQQIITWLGSITCGVLLAMIAGNSEILTFVLFFIGSGTSVVGLNMLLDPIATQLYLNIVCGTSVDFLKQKKFPHYLMDRLKNGTLSTTCKIYPRITANKFYLNFIIGIMGYTKKYLNIIRVKKKREVIKKNLNKKKRLIQRNMLLHVI